MKSYASQDDDFYAEEKQSALQEQQALELEAKKAIPGMIAPGSAGYPGFGNNGGAGQQQNTNNGFSTQ